jgi:hypothetical protein
LLQLQSLGLSTLGETDLEHHVRWVSVVKATRRSIAPLNLARHHFTAVQRKRPVRRQGSREALPPGR